MKLAIMQPYFFPYIGYYQLMNAVDEFVVYDNIEFTKKGWINRNRILLNGKDEYLTLPLKKGPDHLHIDKRTLADSWPMDKKKILNRITESYRKAPNYNNVYPVIENCMNYEDNNLFSFIFNSLNITKEYVGIPTRLVISSTVGVDHSLKAQEKVIAICKARKAAIYLNPAGGMQLYNQAVFNDQGMRLHFLRSTDTGYKQFTDNFVPWLSIIDIMMFNSKEEIRKLLGSYILEPVINK